MVVAEAQFDIWMFNHELLFPQTYFFQLLIVFSIFPDKFNNEVKFTLTRLSYFVIQNSGVSIPSIYVHIFGHVVNVTMTEQKLLYLIFL